MKSHFTNINYGELIEHKTHYDQLKQVPDYEIEIRLNVLEIKLREYLMSSVLVEEVEKHLKKIKEIFEIGW